MGKPVIGYDLSPYCGSPPDPAAIWSRWNLDPVLIAALFLIGAGYLLLSLTDARRGACLPAWKQASFYLGWALACLAVLSPLCALSVSLFSARIAQHMGLATMAAPLVALGLPSGADARARLGGPLTAATAFAIALWFWHAPAPYLATFQSDVVYWLMHATLFTAAVWLWRAVLVNPRGKLGKVMTAAAMTTLQMGALGAVITFANRPLYSVHALTTSAWGLTPLQDQQLGGVIMWVPAGVIIVAALVGGLAVAMRESDGLKLAAPVA